MIATLGASLVLCIGRKKNDSTFIDSITYQEYDDDEKALKCFQKSLKYNATNINTLLALAVSYTNELDKI
jgi:hypothetical protein